jgi:hypothetical protein
MKQSKRPIAVLGAIAAIGVAAVAPSSFAGGETPPPPPTTVKGKCNSGNGNGSEVAGYKCYMGDPGNSYLAGNRGGDEIPTYGGVPNPGGNNVK